MSWPNQTTAADCDGSDPHSQFRALVGHTETTLRVAAVARNRKFNSLLFVCTELLKHFAVVRKRAHKTHKIE